MSIVTIAWLALSIAPSRDAGVFVGFGGGGVGHELWWYFGGTAHW
jgi:hypothetical protein